ncbi:hypothetical protein [Albimonas pacifica]|uniref:Uncharacterized protein n=1 Tax=Albimonas pacifica TaxID=1114924 RepID=A0A1I3LWH2_9RHOB|nr:hypothetical protein [Albimonas pacifica]SFI89062.1 hypothetical protein SAMN05216258_110206 [Albimonas pacifica]
MIARLFRIALALVALLVVVAAALGVVFLETAPLVARAAPPTAQDVTEARRFVRGVRGAIQADADGGFATTESELDSVVRLGARFVPGFRGEVAIGEGRVTGAASIPVPGAGERLWLNLRAAAPAFEGRFRLSSVEVGGVPLPPGPTLEAGRIGANLLFGDRLGDTVLDAAQAMRIEGDAAVFDLAIDQLGQNGVMRGLFGALRGEEMPVAAEVDRYHRLLREAMEAGALPLEGSYLPYLVFTLKAAQEGAREHGPANAYTAAFFALARTCGAKDFAMVVGSLMGGDAPAPEPRAWTARCDALTFNGRIDSRRHFTTAAAIQAASNRGFAVSVGEFKELYDTVKAGGFDFTDIAANNSGIRLSNTFMAAPLEAWPELIARIEAEGDVIVSFEGVPRILSGEAFRARYGEIDSPAYRAELARIEARIDALPLHR